jgi:hypothetical protein
MPTKEYAGLNLFVRNLDLLDPNSVPKRLDSDLAYLHLLAQSGYTYLKCDYRTTSDTLARCYLS